jgi:stage II sporulation protein D
VPALARRGLQPLTLAALLAVVVAAPAAARFEAPAPPSPSAVTFVISGRGWGHGVGLAQYGALGYAKRGVTSDRILAHYYRGTELGAAPVSLVRVLLAEKRAKVKISSTAPFRVRDGFGAVQDLAPGTVTVTAALTLVTAARKQAFSPPLTFLRGAVPLQLDGRAYRGSLELSLDGKRLQAINVVGIDKYLYGVISSEMPHDWPLEALKAQAVAARSYALANRYRGAFDLYADVRSQVYGGIAAETPEARAAVDGTARQVLFYDGRIANTFFFASSGGRTADVTEVWGSKPIPYLVSVNDPHDTLSPYHTWGPVTVQAEKAAKAFKVVGLQDLTPEVGSSGRARVVLAAGVLGSTEVAGSVFRRALGLRSTWVTIGRLALDRPAEPVPYGTRARLTGSVRGLKGVLLEQRPLGAAWQTVAALRPAADGTFVVAVRVEHTTDYRLRSGLSTGRPVRLVVQPY